jgi:hypothetical protein
MNRNLGRFFLVGFVVVMLIMVALLNSCAMATDVNGQPILPNTTPQPVGKEMILVGQHRDVQVYKMIDNMTEVTCYVTISTQQIQESSIFCVK